MSNCCKPKAVEIDLVSNVSGAFNLDPDLVNAWGIVVYDGYIYVTAGGSSLLIRYNECGQCPLKISFYDEGGTLLTDVEPTGLVINPTDGYLIADGLRATRSALLISSESGDIFGYNRCLGEGNKAYRIYNGSSLPNAPVYKGLAVTNKLLFAVDFLNAFIDVFKDVGNVNSINLISRIQRYSLVGPNFASPFNIVHIDNVLFVLYANKASASDTDDLGGGFIDIHNESGVFIRTFNNTDSSLDSPWGLVKAPRSLGCNGGDILVGNFKSGIINVYNKCGARIGELQNGITNVPVYINGLWGLYVKCDRLYFAAGPLDEANGLVGYLERDCCRYRHECC